MKFKKGDSATVTTDYSLQEDSGRGSGKARTSSSSTSNAAAPVWKGSHGARRYDNDEDDHPEHYLSESFLERMEQDKTLSDHDKMIIQRLACRKFFIPGNTFWEDYRFWFANNHPIMCFWFADPRHPLGKRERIVNLVATLAFGLAATSCVILWYHHEQRDFSRVVIDTKWFQLSEGMIMLLICGGPLHVIFDLSLFFLQACPPCRTGGFWKNHCIGSSCWLWIGAHLAFLIAVFSVSLAINVMLMRASMLDDGDDEDGFTTNPKSYSFLLLYPVEVFVANFIAFPLGTFTVFSGVLGCCGRLPGLGGRPFQVRKHERIMARQASKHQQRFEI